MIEGISFDGAGLVPCVVQDAASGEVLTLAYVNEESLRLTLESGEMHFWSRSRSEIWHKGATSGNTQRVVSLRYDCDGDALLALVEPAGPACHTGERTCFYRELGGAADTGADAAAVEGEPALVPSEALPALRRTLAGRAREMPEGSYTTQLLADPELIGAKIREEADEVARALAGESDDRVAEETADLLYHLEVGLTSREVPARAAADVLNRRRRG